MSKYQRLGQRDRVTIQEMFEAGATWREIGTAIGKSHNTVSRELARNKKRGRCYEVSRAHNVKAPPGKQGCASPVYPWVYGGSA